MLIAKVLILKYLYQLSDEDTELQIRDRLSFHDFLDLTNSDNFPDARTIWLEQLKQAGCERKLFDMFNKLLSDNGFEAKGGSIVDAQFVEVPKQRNSREENEQIKKGETPERFERNPNILPHKDLDARKNNEVHYGYKGHIKQDVEHKFIRDDSVTSAEVQKLSNHKVRCRAEHVFGMMRQRVYDETMRCIGKARAVFQIGMRNFVYNLCRYVSLAGG